MRLLFIGDVVGKAGHVAILEEIPALRAAWDLDCIVVNGENAAGGFGVTETICGEFLSAGVDCVTLGNHAFDQREALVFINRQPRLIRPANYPSGTPGCGANLIETAKGQRVLVVNVLGRLFMDALDDPFPAIERELSACPLGAVCDAAIVDFMPKRRARNKPSRISSTGAPRSSAARIRMYRPPIIKSCRKAQAI